MSNEYIITYDEDGNEKTLGQIVRCKNCVNWALFNRLNEFSIGVQHGICKRDLCIMYGLITTEEFFCPYGEKKKEDQIGCYIRRLCLEENANFTCDQCGFKNVCDEKEE